MLNRTLNIINGVQHDNKRRSCIKIYKKDNNGAIKSEPLEPFFGWKFYREIKLSTLENIEKALKGFSNNQGTVNACGVRGKVLDHAQKLDLKQNACFRKHTENISPQAQAWGLLDVDGMEAPEALIASKDLDAIRSYVLERLPEPFKGVSCVFRFSPSMFLKSNNKISAHLWFLFDKEMEDRPVRSYLLNLRKNGFPFVDPSMFNHVHIHALGHHPLLEGDIEQPLTTDERITLVKLEKEEVETAVITKFIKDEEEKRKKNQKPYNGVERNASEKDVQSALDAISPNCSRGEWVSILCAIKDEFGDAGESLADQWSRGGSSYDSKSFQATWDSLSMGRGITIGTLFHKAKEQGWAFPQREIKVSKVGLEDLEGNFFDLPSPKASQPQGSASVQAQQQNNGVPYELNDQTLTNILLKLKGDDLKYIKNKGTFLSWEKNNWVEILESTARTEYGRLLMAYFQKEIMPQFYDNIKDPEEQEKMKKQVWAFYNAHQKAPFYKNLMDDYKGFRKTILEVNQLDGSIYHIGTPNGVLDLKNRTLLDFNKAKSLYVTKKINANFDPNAKAPMFEKFMNSIFPNDKEMIESLQKWFGYCLSGDVSLQQFLFFVGSGGNGKSVLLDVIQHVLGDYAEKQNASAFIEKEYSGGPTSEVAQMAGKRLIYAEELALKQSGRATLDVAMLKDITGGGKVSARFMRQDPFEFQSTAKMMISTNQFPKINDDSDGIWRRLVIIPFEQKFKGEQADASLQEKLKKEASGILNWMLEGFRKFMEANKKINWPAECLEQAKNLRQENDIVGRFCEEELEVSGDNKDKVSASALYQTYTKWCQKEGHKPSSNVKFKREFNRVFASELENNSIQNKEQKQGNVVLGLKFKIEEDIINLEEAFEFNKKASVQPEPEPKKAEAQVVNPTEDQKLYDFIKDKFIKTNIIEDISFENFIQNKEDILLGIHAVIDHKASNNDTTKNCDPFPVAVHYKKYCGSFIETLEDYRKTNPEIDLLSHGLKVLTQAGLL
jgi:P4 family phage/plasmid primase-like protien